MSEESKQIPTIENTDAGEFIQLTDSELSAHLGHAFYTQDTWLQVFARREQTFAAGIQLLLAADLSGSSGGRLSINDPEVHAMIVEARNRIVQKHTSQKADDNG